MLGVLGKKPLRSHRCRSYSPKVSRYIPDLGSGVSEGQHETTSMTQCEYTPHQQPYPHGKICVGYHELLPEHLETDSLLMSYIGDGMIELEKAHGLYHELAVSQLIGVKKLIASLNRIKILYLVNETNPLKYPLVDLMTLTESLIHEPPLSFPVLGISKVWDSWSRRLHSLLLLLGFCLWVTSNSLLTNNL